MSRRKRHDSRVREAQRANKISAENLRVAKFLRELVEHQSDILRELRRDNNFAVRIAQSYERAR